MKHETIYIFDVCISYYEHCETEYKIILNYLCLVWGSDLKYKEWKLFHSYSHHCYEDSRRESAGHSRQPPAGSLVRVGSSLTGQVKQEHCVDFSLEMERLKDDISPKIGNNDALSKHASPPPPSVESAADDDSARAGSNVITITWLEICGSVYRKIRHLLHSLITVHVLKVTSFRYHEAAVWKL